jgi:putative transposase
MTKRTRRSFSAAEKAKIVCELLREDKTLNEVAQGHEIHPKMLSQWKVQFFENAELAFDKDRGLRDLREALKESGREKDELHRQIGKLTAEVNWAKKKSVEAGLVCETIFDKKRR